MWTAVTRRMLLHGRGLREMGVNKQSLCRLALAILLNRGQERGHGDHSVHVVVKHPAHTKGGVGQGAFPKSPAESGDAGLVTN